MPNKYSISLKVIHSMNHPTPHAKGGTIMLDEYYTVKPSGKDQLYIQKSRFIGYVRRVNTEEDAQQFIQEIKKKHYDATHNCSAYIIGQKDEIQKANDDGEPGGTAGVPMLEVLKKQNLKNTAVVVTRYFGGIKLGAGGLIRAYSRATAKAIQATGIVKRKLMQGFSITIEYPLLGRLENELRNSKYIIDSIDYTEKVILNVFVQRNEGKSFYDWIVDLTGDQATIAKTKQAYIEVEVDSET